MEKDLFTVDTKQFITSLSFALDLAEKSIFEDNLKHVRFDAPVDNFNPRCHNFLGHSKRTALISLYIARKMGFHIDRYYPLYTASFLHDIGSVHAFNKCHNDSNYIWQHCSLGADLINNFSFNNSVSGFVRFHHENSNGTGPFGLSGGKIPCEAQIIHLADCFDLMFSLEIPYRFQQTSIINQIKSKRGRIFSFEAVDALLDAASVERFWLDLENLDSCPEIFDELLPRNAIPETLLDVKTLSKAFAAIIDMKSQFTLDHSLGLQDIISKYSGYTGFSESKTEKMEIAALLHDIGKLSVPSHLLDKPGKLTLEEFKIIKTHTYFTKRILQKITGFEDICPWAANHHETLKGTGYPEGLTSEELPPESKIMTVCDIYQALTEDRPYRKGMDRLKAFEILNGLAGEKAIDAGIVNNLKNIV